MPRCTLAIACPPFARTPLSQTLNVFPPLPLPLFARPLPPSTAFAIRPPTSLEAELSLPIRQAKPLAVYEPEPEPLRSPRENFEGPTSSAALIFLSIEACRGCAPASLLGRDGRQNQYFTFSQFAGRPPASPARTHRCQLYAAHKSCPTSTRGHFSRVSRG